MDNIESIMFDDQLLFLDEINKMTMDGYKVIHTNTFYSECEKIVWVAILKKRVGGN